MPEQNRLSSKKRIVFKNDNKPTAPPKPPEEKRRREVVQSIDKPKTPPTPPAVEEDKHEIRESSRVDRTNYQTLRTQTKNLPSNFLPYPKGTQIFWDAYTYQEISILSNRNLPLTTQYEIMLQGIHVEGIDRMDLTIFDFNYISLERHLASLNASEWNVPYRCNKCGATGLHRFGLTDIAFEEITAPKLPIKLDVGDREIEFTPLTIGQFLDAHLKDRMYLRHKDGSVVTDEMGEPMADQITLLSYSSDMEFKEGYEYFSTRKDPALQIAFNDILAYLDHDTAPLEFRCSNRLGEAPKEDPESNVPAHLRDTREICNHPIKVVLIGGESLIVPFREPEKSSGPRISFG